MNSEKSFPTPSSRRTFFRQTAAAVAGLIGVPQLLHAANRHVPAPLAIPDEAIILFQGDSITDAGRRRDQYYANDAGGMGSGYVHHIVTELLGRNPQKNLRCYNRGVSGNKVYQLAERWEEDCLDLRPDVLSILIGVNDFWHTLTNGYDGTPDLYERDFRRLLDRTRTKLPEVRLVIGEPFAVAGGRAITAAWYPEFDKYREAARRVAEAYSAVFIPYQTIFDKALEQGPVSYWCPDGVHPSLGGAYLMGQAWLEGDE